MSNLIKGFTKIILSITIILFIISLSAKITLNFKPLYFFDIGYLNIEEISNISRETIEENYNYLIEYINGSNDMEFKLPTLPSSEFGVIHFKEVKAIFETLDKVLIISLIVTFIGLLINYRDLKSVLSHVAAALISIPLLISIGFISSFNYSFILFHKIFFRNNYWVFSPDEDPIINLLPQEFFMHSAILILVLILSTGIILKVILKKSFKRKLTYVNPLN